MNLTQTLGSATAMMKPGKIVNNFPGQARHRSDEYLERWLAAIVESSDDAIMSEDLNSIIATWNRGAEALFGYTAEEVVGRSVTLLTPPGHQNEEPEILERIKRGESVAGYETVHRHKDGTLIDISLKVSPIKMVSGEVIGASTIIHDIRERKRAQEVQELLVREMSHRVTNVLAVASGLVALSARTGTDPKTMAKAIQERLTAFTRAHELTRPGLLGSDRGEGQRSTLRTLIRTIVAPYADFGQVAGRSCVVVEGDDIAIGGNSITGLALVLHEFTTNAAKYGALSSPAGSVRLVCTQAEGNLLLTWTENGGPRIAGVPEKEGFGTVLARRTVGGQFGGDLSYDWAPEGLVIRVRLALKRIV
jgi:PAS domain S-box-containing protein